MGLTLKGATVQKAEKKEQPAVERLDGSVERVTFHSEASGFSVLRVRVRGRRDDVVVVGPAAGVTPGEQIEAFGAWTNDKTYGQQFKATVIQTSQPTTAKGIERYLGSGLVKGIGPHFAKVLVQSFGTKVFEVIDKRPDQLRQIPGIGEKRVERIVSAWSEQKVVREIFVFLQGHGLGTARAYRIYKTYGAEAITKVSENPYRLALDIDGIGFKTSDTLARSLGIDPTSMIRARAGVRHVLQLRSNDGHCAASRDGLIREAAELLEIGEETISEAIGLELSDKNLVAGEIAGTLCLYLAPLHKAEAGVAASLARIMAAPLPWGAIDRAVIPAAEKSNGFTLAESQRAAVSAALSGKALVLVGGPGTGKTTLLNLILKILTGRGVAVTLCAPTGRAAKRLSEVTGLEAKTIHRTLEFDPKAGGFKRGRETPLETELLVIDEASMVDVVLMNRLLAAVPDEAAVLIVGDVDQLPSVGPGAVLADIIASGAVPVARLTEIHRQAASSRIITNAHRINRGLLPEKHAGQDLTDFYTVYAETPEEIHARVLQLVTERIPERFGFDPVRQVQVLTPMVRGGLGTISLNAELQKALNPKDGPSLSRYGTTFKVDDKVVMTANNYDLDVMNGALGVIRELRDEDDVAVIDFDGQPTEVPYNGFDQIQLGYACTIHKSQGSEIEAVVIPLAMQHYLMLKRNLLYTAVTRGRKLVVVIGPAKALAMAVRNADAGRRLTNLADRLRG